MLPILKQPHQFLNFRFMFIVPPPEAKCGGSLDITKVDLGLFVTVFVIFRISLNILYKNVHFFDKNNKTEIC